MNVADLLSRVQALGIRLSVQGDALAFEGRRETITPELLDQLRSCKPLLLALLETPTSPDIESAREWRQERAAIMEFDGGLDRVDAEREAQRRVSICGRLH